MGELPDQGAVPVLPAAALVAGFPLALLVLTELVNSGQRRGWRLTPTLRAVRNLVLPSLAAVLFVTHVWRLPDDSAVARVAHTVFWLCTLLAALSFINDGVFGEAAPGSWQERVPKLLRDLARAAVTAFGLAIIYSVVWKQELSGALTALGVGGIVIGLALQEPLGNVVSGLMLLMERPLGIGDWVIADGATGRVIEINWRSVHIETVLHEMRIIPNVVLYKNSFSNLSRPTDHWTETHDVGFSYDHPPNVVKRAMLDILESTPGVLPEPRPAVHTVGYGDFSITYRLYFTVGSYGDVLPVRDAIITRIWYVARRAGLQIPFPIQMEYRPFESPSAPPPTVDGLLERFPRYRVAREAMKRAGDDAAAASADGGLPPARVVNFARGEEIQAFGDTVPDFVLIAEGHAALFAADAEGRAVRIADLGPGDFYGEATISAGRPSEFRVVADTDIVAVSFAAAALAPHLQVSGGLAAEIGDTLESRRRAAQAIRRSTAPER